MADVNPQLISLNESAFLLKVAEGNELAYTQLVEKYWQKVLQHALTFVKSYPIAEELAQDVFIQIWEKREKLLEVNSFDNYLFIVSRNLIITHIRKKLQVTETLNEEMKREELFISPSDLLEYSELNETILKGVDLLPEPRRTIFLLSRVEGKDSDYISTTLGLAKRTVRWHIAEALQFLRNHLHQYYKIFIISYLLIKCCFFS